MQDAPQYHPFFGYLQQRIRFCPSFTASRKTSMSSPVVDVQMPKNAIPNSKCNPCVKIATNLKPIKKISKWELHMLCNVPNEDIQLDLGGPNYYEKNQKFTLFYA